MASQKHLIFAALTTLQELSACRAAVVLMHPTRTWHPGPSFSSSVAPVSFQLLPSPPGTPSKGPDMGPVFGACYFLKTSVGLCPNFPSFLGTERSLREKLREAQGFPGEARMGQAFLSPVREPQT